MKRLIVFFSFITITTLISAMGCLLAIKVQSDISNLTLSNSPVFKQISFADRQLARMTLRQKVSNLLILHTSGTNVADIQKYLQTYQPSGLIFMGDNIPSTLDDLALITKKLQSSPALPYLFAIDEEGGVVSRLSQDILPAAADFKSQPPFATESAFRKRCEMLQQVGMNLNFGIVADVTNDPASFIFTRVFGGDPLEAGHRVAAAVDGSIGLTLSTLKHYPGHGETNADSHNSIPVTNVSYESWQQRDEPSFVSGVKANADVVMFGHLIYSSVDSLPASLSTKWHEILRQQDGFKGVTITDDMIMLQQSGDPDYADPISNSIKAINAGNTMLLFVLDHGGDSIFDPSILIEGIVNAVKNGKVNQKIIDDNVRQILTLRHNLPVILAKK
ncbi:glycosyl hydrolase family 3 [Candidatus Saccharibacteria bacterium CG11_big_fil_rev_8_21_14_0_20_41_19]|nr:glycoside hydrolase family 3 protein [Candidatus Saccharibacteria bacterium]OIP86354.1 MAG: hypothetical protein AUK57_01115 [Candidatus Saccharibacteria bacterium CG2_30_41_52]PIQ71137.1 MAG: glycosyl hydrolase family 3 [Candidatus Saccharibacteria bacterium CG11_big_fil_rev_8_21_14_0_20_41_19]PIZ59954.1 MAG: glycosyl hydrolase family 3 [Candidatus Saccharibacteria bacterium CG_4_10_14_0_2_um_filter_41_11]PJE65960.1 MAG: glycosyl hydrolase family 3 [Candidatus Saccharibacteria bacterium CG1